MLKNTWKQVWQVLNTDISWSSATQAGVDSSKAVLELAKTINDNRNAAELAPLIGRMSSLLDVLNSPLAQVAGSALPFIPLAIGLLKFIAEQTKQEPTLEMSVALVSQAAYLESLRVFLRNPEQRNVLERVADQPASEKMSQELRRFGKVLELRVEEDSKFKFKVEPFDLDDREAKSVLVCFHNSKLAQIYNSLLTARFQDAGLGREDSDILTERVSRNTHRYLKESFAAAKNTVKSLTGIYGDGWVEDLKIYESIDQYLETIAAKPKEQVFAEKFTFRDIYVPLQARTVGKNGEIDNNSRPCDLEGWTKTCLEDANAQSQVMFVQAGPGRGKSVFCRMFADWVRRELHPIWTPILIRLRDITIFEKNIEETLQSVIGWDFTTDKCWLTDSNTRFLFLLDGFDELLMEGRTSSGLEHFLTQIGRFQEACAGNPERGHRVLITGRPLALQTISSFLPPNLNRVAILPLTPDQQGQWLAKWEKLVGTDKANDYLSFLRDNQCPKQVKELAQEPLLMYLLGAMHRDEKIGINLFTEANRGPTTIRAKILIYQKSLDWVLTEQRPEWLNRDLTDLETEGLRRILTEAGLCVIQVGGEAAPIQMIEDRLNEDEDALNLINLARERLQKDALRNALAAFYLRPAQGEQGSVEFIHKSFSEFLCAQRLFEICEAWTLPGPMGRGYTIKPTQMDWEIYDVLSFDRLTVEIVDYWRALLETKEGFKAEILFQRLVEFYERWCGGEFIDLSMQTTLPQRKVGQLRDYGIHLGQRKIDIDVGLNVLILLLELHCYSQHTKSLKHLHFHPCGQPESEVFEKTRLLNLIGYSQCLSITGFRDTVGRFLHRANLNGADLHYVDLSGADLSGANLSGANLSRANLSRANLKNAKLSDANLSGADLSDANLSDTDLSDANLSDTILFDANLKNAKLSDANLSGADLRRAELCRADFSRVIMIGTNLRSANLSDANLSDANLSDANLSGASLRRANLSRANLIGANLIGADLSGADLSGTNLSHEQARQAIL
ncbi:pentapeptide repeat-containing protein [Acaryochloris sp. IP29b_bin.148]|uniref:pentapeptide repeat-containing protein n=1 Tax=Acaryochloris sp. IP29b_bin.148 TaxID=2969218 RepID=UPI00260D7F68|nr:pentapeptide repeat-containing protein [Acaryochloris sp. IP29b_bin.148]